MPRQRGERRFPIGAEVQPGGVAFRVWAPKHRAAEVVLEAGPGAGEAVALEPEEGGYFSAFAPRAAAGTRYRFRLGKARPLYADPASRFQPEGPFGPSEVIDPDAYHWADAAWQGPESVAGHVFYELHVGTFTPEGTFAAAAEQLPALAELGITALELMPVSTFPGKFGWSYDGVNLFAPYPGYGTPDDFRRFVDRAHALGLAVLLDVVFNHLGPEGNVLPEFSDDYFSKRHKTEWGEALNFDGDHAGPVREFVLTNAALWAREFHVDGLRIDATQGMFDESGRHIVADLPRRLREAAAPRRVLVVGENEPQHAALLRPADAGGYGYGYDLLWSDDFHHAAMVAATGSREGYYGDYLGTAQEFVSALKRGWLYQGQWNLRQAKRRGTPALDISPAAFLFYLQNHDQLANSARGERLHQVTDPGTYRLLTALLLLAPATPLLFQGQEFAASAPFLYFGDLSPETAAQMHQGRREFVRQFASLATPAMQERVPAPADPETFRRSRLDHSERTRGKHAEAWALHRDLIRLRKSDPALANQAPGATDGAVLGAGQSAFVLRRFGPDGPAGDRLLLANLGTELRLDTAPEPLLAPPEGRRWSLLWSSEDPRYGGGGAPEVEAEAFNWRLPGHSAVVLAAALVPDGEDEHRDLPGSP